MTSPPPAAGPPSHPGRWHRWRARATELRRAGWRRLRGGELTPARAAASVALGLFIGCLPVFGLHLPLVAAICIPLRLDTPVAYLAANISNPLIAPWLVVAEVQTGAWLLTRSFVPFDVSAAKAAGIAGFAQYAAVGALVVGAAVAAVGGLIALLLTMAVKRARRRAG